VNLLIIKFKFKIYVYLYVDFYGKNQCFLVNVENVE